MRGVRPSRTVTSSKTFVANISSGRVERDAAENASNTREITHAAPMGAPPEFTKGMR